MKKAVVTEEQVVRCSYVYCLYYHTWNMGLEVVP